MPLILENIRGEDQVQGSFETGWEDQSCWVGSPVELEEEI